MKNMYSNVACGGMDVHYKFSTVTFRDKAGTVVRRERLEHRERDRLRDRIDRWPKGLPIVLEASFGWGWLSDLLDAAGLKPHLSNCYKLEQMRKARGWVKTNQKDADLVSLLPFEASTWWEVWRAPPEVRDQREQMRFRGDLVGLQTMVKNRIHAIFHRQWVTTPLVRRLKTIQGIGLVLAHVLAAEIGRIERFGNHKRLASYSLLAPRADDTGEADWASAPLGRHLGTRGNRTLKWAFIEAAHAAVRSGGRWRAMFDRVTQGGRKDRNRGYIKVARELVKVVYGVWAKGIDYKPIPPVRPGCQKNQKKSRSGTGQLCHPMVHALTA